MLWPSRKRLHFSLSGCRGRAVEGCGADEHAMHDHRKLARKRHFGLLHAGPRAIRIAQLLSVVQPLTGLVSMMCAVS